MANTLPVPSGSERYTKSRCT